MKKCVRDVMTLDPTMMPASATVTEAARVMRERDIGNVLVMDGTRLCGIATDRDLVIRALAEGKDPGKTALSSVCSGEITAVHPDDEIERVVALMKKKAIRRMPVVEDGAVKGIVSIGDLAQARDGKSALGRISAASPNH
jgi:CBS domain-containing protein